jgi:hypothetical protein
MLSIYKKIIIVRVHNMHQTYVTRRGTETDKKPHDNELIVSLHKGSAECEDTPEYFDGGKIVLRSS